MAANRLFLYDPETNSAVCIAKGYSSGWSFGKDHVDKWLDEVPPEWCYDIKGTRFQLKTENDIPPDAKLTFASSPPTGQESS